MGQFVVLRSQKPNQAVDAPGGASVRTRSECPSSILRRMRTVTFIRTTGIITLIGRVGPEVLCFRQISPICRLLPDG